MAWRLKFAFNVLHKFITTPKPIQNPSPTTLQHFHSSLFPSRILCPKLYPRYSSFLWGIRLKKSSFLGGARRYYHANRHQLTHLWQRGYKRWLKNPVLVLNAMHQVTEFCSKHPKFAVNAALIGTGAVVTVCFGKLETVPYTNRRRFVVLSTNLEKRLGEHVFAKTKEEHKNNILPENHPDTVRVGLIAKNIINVLQRGLITNIGYSSDSPKLLKTSGLVHQAFMSLMPSNYSLKGDITNLDNKRVQTSPKEDAIIDDKWVETSPKEDEILDAKQVQKSPKEDEILDNKSRLQKERKKSIRKMKKLAIEHVKAFKWEVIVVDERYTVNAFCAPGGKIVVFTGLLRKFRTDNEIATILGHEVGHALGRHVAEGLTKALWFIILSILLYQIVPEGRAVNAIIKYLLQLPFSRKLEKEADHIGLFLMALAGYDPRVAPGVFKKLDDDGDDVPFWSDYDSTHPSGKKRAKLLSRTKVMEEALRLYHQTTRRRLIEENGGSSPQSIIMD